MNHFSLKQLAFFFSFFDRKCMLNKKFENLHACNISLSSNTIFFLNKFENFSNKDDLLNV